MLDQEPDEAFVCAKRRAVNAERNLIDVIATFVAKIETTRLREIDLVRRDGKLAADRAPGLHIDLRPVKRGFVWYLDVIDAGIFQHISRHHFGLLPKFRFIDK